MYDGIYLTRKAANNLVEKFIQGSSKLTDNVRPATEMSEAKVKRLPRSGVRCTGKAMEQVYQCWWKIR
jgi:hypothetical protein